MNLGFRVRENVRDCGEVAVDVYRGPTHCGTLTLLVSEWEQIVKDSRRGYAASVVLLLADLDMIDRSL